MKRATIRRLIDFACGVAFTLTFAGGVGMIAEAGPFGVFGGRWSSGGCANGQCGQAVVTQPAVKPAEKPKGPQILKPPDPKEIVRKFLQSGL